MSSRKTEAGWRTIMHTLNTECDAQQLYNTGWIILTISKEFQKYWDRKNLILCTNQRGTPLHTEACHCGPSGGIGMVAILVSREPESNPLMQKRSNCQTITFSKVITFFLCWRPHFQRFWANIWTLSFTSILQYKASSNIWIYGIFLSHKSGLILPNKAENLPPRVLALVLVVDD